MGVARTHRLGVGGWNCDAAAGCVPAPRTGSAAEKAQNPRALTARGALKSHVRNLSSEKPNSED